ncbi:MAG: hypothetical protein QOG20_1216 [Pseudonocardiales bacterium]|nr:hypothetical protein [Pseudonocardia sp.]MDT7617665.1 hypothetical protein [Pseudonocardiales bacterium]MDT7705609.1 hypothetical protein [Pseudonocardiales bacterium]
MRYKSSVEGQSPQVVRTVVVVNVKKIVGLLVVALLIYFVVVQPNAAANSVHNIGTILKNAADSVTSFFTQIV